MLTKKVGKISLLDSTYAISQRYQWRRWIPLTISTVSQHRTHALLPPRTGPCKLALSRNNMAIACTDNLDIVA